MANRTHRPGLALRRAQRGQREPWLLTLPLGVLGGLLLALAFPPWGAAPLAFIGPALLVVAIGGAPPGRRLLAGFLFGAAFFAPVLWWVERVGVDAWVLLVVVEAAFARSPPHVMPSAWRIPRQPSAAVVAR